LLIDLLVRWYCAYCYNIAESTTTAILLTRWKHNLDEKRTQFYHVNHFNIQQIVYLCQELASAMETKRVPDQVCTLLEFVKPDVTGDEIIELLKEATKVKEENVEEIAPEEGMSFSF